MAETPMPELLTAFQSDTWITDCVPYPLLYGPTFFSSGITPAVFSLRAPPPLLPLLCGLTPPLTTCLTTLNYIIFFHVYLNRSGLFSRAEGNCVLSCEVLKVKQARYRLFLVSKWYVLRENSVSWNEMVNEKVL